MMLDTVLATVGVDEARVCRTALREGLILQHAGRRVTSARPRRSRASKSAQTPLSA
jgi:exopolyphosphatase/pppGpp-phosphohydrolase